MSRVAALVLYVLCGGYALSFIDRGWIPSDEGVLAQTAERVLRGEVPHRDFDDLYTGGLTYLHAGGMAVLGTNLKTPRLILFGFFMAFLAATYAIANRVASRSAALVSMVLVTVWTVPNYFAGMPSWYNLFLAVFGILGLLMFLDSHRRVWLLLAGVAGGLSVLIKIVGLFYLAGGLLFLAYFDHLSRLDAETEPPSRFWMVLAMPGAVFVWLLTRLLFASPAAIDFVPMFLPAIVICVFVIWRERAVGRGSIVLRVRSLAGLAWPFAAGAALPLMAYGLWYWQVGAMGDLMQGVFVLPYRRIAEESISPLPLATIGLSVPYALLLIVAGRRRIPYDWVWLALVGLVLLFAERPMVYRAIWAVLRSSPFVAVAAAVAMLGSSTPLPIPKVRRAQVFLLVAMAATTALIQFPYAAQIYFCYAAPLTILAVIALVSAQVTAPRRVHAGIAMFFVLFAMLYVNRSYAWNLGSQFIPFDPRSRLDLDRGGALRVFDDDKVVYEDVVKVIRDHMGDGTIYAGPVCPELYFLSGAANPTRQVLDLLSRAPEDEATLGRLLSRAPIRVAVINTTPMLSSPPMPADMVALLERRFPSSQQVGPFIVRW